MSIFPMKLKFGDEATSVNLSWHFYIRGIHQQRAE